MTMSPLEHEITNLRDALLSLPDSAEKTIALRAVRHALSLLSRDIVSASDAFYRARRFYNLASNLRKSA